MMKRTIVCFEPSDYISNKIKKELKYLECDIHVVNSGVAGIIKIYELQPSLIILNPILKIIDGINILKLIKEESELKEIPVIVYSTITDPVAQMFFDIADSLIKKDSNFIENLRNSSEKLILKERSTVQCYSPSSEDVLLKLERVAFYRDIKSKLLKELIFIGQEIEDVEALTNSLDMFFQDKFNKEQNITDDKELYFYHFCRDIADKIILQAETFGHNMKTVKNLNSLFANFLPKKVISDLLKKDDISSLMIGEKREVAVLFSHVREFSAIEQQNEVNDVVDFLNSHFTGLSKGIKNYGGEINKFIGDAVFAMFGAPVSYDDNETRVANAAIEMIKFINDSQSSRLTFGKSGYRIGIGIHIGKAIIGNIGSDDNFDFTAIGDTINLAARLESLCKYYDKDILVSSEMHDGCRKQKFADFFREIDTVMVKGKNEPTTIFSLEDISLYPEGFISLYSKGIKMFKLGNWVTAKEYFTKCNIMNHGDRIISIYLDRCIEYLEQPPLNWNGAVVLNFK